MNRIISLCGCLQADIPLFKGENEYAAFFVSWHKLNKQHYNNNQLCWAKAKTDSMWLQRENRDLTVSKSYGIVEDEEPREYSFDNGETLARIKEKARLMKWNKQKK